LKLHQNVLVIFDEAGIYLALRGHNILITGFPGTGKSFTVIELAKQLKAVGKNVVVICVLSTF
jgi:putative protein kinase ArgK-like GTPase of G3E family